MTHTKPAPDVVRRGENVLGEALGTRLEVKASARDTNGAFTLIDYAMEGDWPGPPRHYHEATDEGFYILEGAFRFELDDAVVEARPGDWVFVPRGTVHRADKTTDGPGRMLVWFAPGGFEGYFEELFTMLQENPVWPPEDTAKLVRLGKKYDQHLPNSGATGLR